MSRLRIRPARSADLGAISELAELERAEAARHEPDLWRASPTARLAHEPWLAYLVARAGEVTLVAERHGSIDGFISLHPSGAPAGLRFRGSALGVDEFALRRGRAWAEIGRALLDSALRHADPREPALLTVPCARAERAKGDMLRAAGLVARCAMRVTRLARASPKPTSDDAKARRATPRDAAAIVRLAERLVPHRHGVHLLWREPPSLDGYARLLARRELVHLVVEARGRTVGYALGLAGVPPSPVHDPGGSGCLVDEFVLAPGGDWAVTGAVLLSALEDEARVRGDVQLTVACGRGEADKERLLDGRGYRRPVEWYSGVIGPTSSRRTDAGPARRSTPIAPAPPGATPSAQSPRAG